NASVSANSSSPRQNCLVSGAGCVVGVGLVQEWRFVMICFLGVAFPGRANSLTTLSVARRTAGELLDISYPVPISKFVSQLGLVGGRLPGHAEHGFKGTKVRLGVAVALQAPAHKERLLLVRKRHAVDAPVTFDAADALVDVDAVVEIDKFGQVMDP